jgi:hypothetical protein
VETWESDLEDDECDLEPELHQEEMNENDTLEAQVGRASWTNVGNLQTDPRASAGTMPENFSPSFLMPAFRESVAMALIHNQLLGEDERNPGDVSTDEDDMQTLNDPAFCLKHPDYKKTLAGIVTSMRLRATATPAAIPKVGRNELTRGRRGQLSGAKRGTCTSVSILGAMPTPMTVATCLGGEQSLLA